MCRMPSKANNFNFDLTCLICCETFKNQTDIKNHGCQKFVIKCGCCLNTFTVRNELASHLNQKGIYQSEPMDLPSTADQSGPDTATNTLDNLEQILHSVNIPTVHTIADQVGDVPQSQVLAAAADSEEDITLTAKTLQELLNTEKKEIS